MIPTVQLLIVPLLTASSGCLMARWWAEEVNISKLEGIFMSSFQSSICGDVTRRPGCCHLLLYVYCCEFFPWHKLWERWWWWDIFPTSRSKYNCLPYCILYFVSAPLVFFWPMTTGHRVNLPQAVHNQDTVNVRGHSGDTLGQVTELSNTIQELLILPQTEGLLGSLYHNCDNKQTKPGLRYCYVCEWVSQSSL